MTDLKQFVSDAIRTESKIENVAANSRFLFATIEAAIAIGNILDMIKKNVFYKKPIDDDKLTDLLQQAYLKIEIIGDMTDEEIADVEVIPTVDPRLFHALIGIATESTELLEALHHTMIWGEQDNVNIREELGDINWYQAIAIDTTEGDFDTVLATVIKKLRARFPDKYSDEKAINRDLKTEREILEGK